MFNINSMKTAEQILKSQIGDFLPFDLVRAEDCVQAIQKALDSSHQTNLKPDIIKAQITKILLKEYTEGYSADKQVEELFDVVVCLAKQEKPHVSFNQEFFINNIPFMLQKDGDGIRFVKLFDRRKEEDRQIFSLDPIHPNYYGYRAPDISEFKVNEPIEIEFLNYEWMAQRLLLTTEYELPEVKRWIERGLVRVKADATEENPYGKYNFGEPPKFEEDILQTTVDPQAEYGYRLPEQGELKTGDVFEYFADGKKWGETLFVEDNDAVWHESFERLRKNGYIRVKIKK